MVDGNDISELKQSDEGESGTSSESSDLASESSSNPDTREEPRLDITVDERLVRAESCKLSGNSSFREKDNHEAIRFYEKGLDLLKVLEDKSVPEILDDHVVKRDELFCSLLLNKAAACNRCQKWKESINSATKAEKFIRADDKDTLIKLHFRRGTAYSQIKDLDGAKKDFASVLKLDPKNRLAAKELTSIRKSLAIIRERERRGFGKAFSSGGMYEDKERERLMRKKREKEKLAKEREEYEKEKQELEEKGEPTTSFEEWKEKNRMEKEEEERKRKEKEEEERKVLEAKRFKERKEQTKKEVSSSQDEDDIELDEEDIAVINDVKAKGYCHFKREQSQEEKELLEKTVKPSLLKDDLQVEKVTNSKQSGVSAWNQAGTWEEKDVADNVKNILKETLRDVIVTLDNITIRTKSVNDISGECQIVMVNGKKGSWYDMSLQIRWEGIIENESETLYEIDEDTDQLEQDKEEETNAEQVISGRLNFPDISNGVDNRNYECSLIYDNLEDNNTPNLELLKKALQKFEIIARDTIGEVIEEKILQ